MAEYIEREAAIKAISTAMGKVDRKIMRDRLMSIPSADVREVVRGRWTEYHTKCGKGYGKIYYQHEECSCQIFEAPYNFCPNCGADMREEQA